MGGSAYSLWDGVNMETGFESQRKLHRTLKKMYLSVGEDWHLLEHGKRTD